MALVKSTKGWRAEIEHIAMENIKSCFFLGAPCWIKANAGNKGCAALGNLRASATGLGAQVTDVPWPAQSRDHSISSLPLAPPFRFSLILFASSR